MRNKHSYSEKKFIERIKINSQEEKYTKKSAVALTRTSLTLRTVKEYLIISITFIFNLHFQFFVVGELSAFIFIVFNILPKFPYFA